MIIGHPSCHCVTSSPREDERSLRAAGRERSCADPAGKGSAAFAAAARRHFDGVDYRGVEYTQKGLEHSQNGYLNDSSAQAPQSQPGRRLVIDHATTLARLAVRPAGPQRSCNRTHHHGAFDPVADRLTRAINPVAYTAAQFARRRRADTAFFTRAMAQPRMP